MTAGPGPKDKPAERDAETAAKNNPQHGNRKEDSSPPGSPVIMGRRANNWGDGYGEKTINMSNTSTWWRAGLYPSNTVNPMNNMERDNLGSGMHGVNPMQQMPNMQNGTGSTNPETMHQMQMMGRAEGAGGAHSLMSGNYMGRVNMGG